SWLHGVAYRTAMRTKSQGRQRQAHERQAASMLKTEPNERELWQELQPVIDEELNRLPSIYRDAVVLCYLQGKSNEEAARHLGCPAGTLRSRLSRGLEKLRHGLVRRGFGVSVCALGTVLAENVSASMFAAG